MRTCIVLAALLLLVGSLASAQRETGAIEGLVKDSEGRAIPRVTIVATSPALIGGSATTFTGNDGTYRFPVLPPGKYDVKAELDGFQTVAGSNIQVPLGITVKLDFTLQLIRVTETVQVIEATPLIDATTPAISHTIPNDMVRNLPKLENIQDLMRLTPGVSDDLVAYGADGPSENSVWVDGVSVSDPKSGRLITSYDYNWIDQVHVTGIGAPAEFGGFTGVLGNFITRSGGNQFHGLFEVFFENEDLVSTNTPDPAPEVPFTNYDFSAQVGGPILRDRLWFFSGFEYPHTETHPFGFPGVVTETYKKFITKLTYKWNQDNTVHGFAHWNDRRIDNFGAAFDVVLPEATTNRTEPQASWNGTWISLLNTSTILEARVGGFYSNKRDLEDQPELSCHIDGGVFSVNSCGRQNEKRVRLQANAAMSHYAEDFLMGGHDFKFGTEFERSNITSQTLYNGGMVYLDYYGMPYYRYVTDGYDVSGSNDRLSLFAQDDWNITDRATVSLGIRWDHNRGSTDRGLVFANDPVAPRIGIVWKLDSNNETILKAHYGDYYEALLEKNYFFLSDGVSDFVLEFFDQGQWIEVARSGPTISSLSKDLKEPFVRQFTIGVDHILPGGIPIGAHYIYRRWHNILANVALSGFAPVPYVNPINGETITVFTRTEENAQTVFTNPPGLYRRYDGVEFFASKQFKNKFSFAASFIYSQLKGNTQNITNRTVAGITPNSAINFPGQLLIHRPIAWKISGTYPLPWGFNAGWYFRHESGNTWTATIPVTGLIPPFFRVFGEPAGSRQLPSRNLLDLRFEKEFSFYGGQLRGTVDVFNVFNSSYAVEVDDHFESPDFGNPRAFNEPREIRLGIRYTF